MNKTKIDWCDMSWNPVTGCLYGCPYCYARSIAERFSGAKGITTPPALEKIDLHKKMLISGKVSSFPYGFLPAFHRYRLEEPAQRKNPQNIFVCSMADLFGEWVPDEWIQEVFKACEKAPQHRYLFLTKNPERYKELNKKNLLPCNNNFWFGTSTETENSNYWYSENHNFFISIEPIMSEFTNMDTEVKRIISGLYIPWVIVGAETGNRKDKVIPKKEWIQNILDKCREQHIPVFVKNNLAKIWGEPLVQEYPWSCKKEK